MRLNEARLTVRHMLVIAPSNVGDAVLTLPVIAELATHFPKAQLTIAGGPRARTVFDGDPRVAAFVEYGGDAHTWRDRLRILQNLRQQSFDIVLDMRHTILPWLLRARWRTSPLQQPPAQLVHRRDRYQWYLEHILRQIGVRALQLPTPTNIWSLTSQEQQQVGAWWDAWTIEPNTPVIAVSPGARSDNKRWPTEQFAAVCQSIAEQCQARVLMTGETNEQHIADVIEQRMTTSPISLMGHTTVRTLAGVLMRCQAVVTNDSAALHVASSINLPTVALFGPTDPAKYGPRGVHTRIIQRPHITEIPTHDVITAVREVLHVPAHHTPA